MTDRLPLVSALLLAACVTPRASGRAIAVQQNVVVPSAPASATVTSQESVVVAPAVTRTESAPPRPFSCDLDQRHRMDDRVLNGFDTLLLDEDLPDIPVIRRIEPFELHALCISLTLHTPIGIPRRPLTASPMRRRGIIGTARVHYGQDRLTPMDALWERAAHERSNLYCGDHFGESIADWHVPPGMYATAFEWARCLSDQATECNPLVQKAQTVHQDPVELTAQVNKLRAWMQVHPRDPNLTWIQLEYATILAFLDREDEAVSSLQQIAATTNAGLWIREYALYHLAWIHRNTDERWSDAAAALSLSVGHEDSLEENTLDVRPDPYDAVADLSWELLYNVCLWPQGIRSSDMTDPLPEPPLSFPPVMTTPRPCERPSDTQSCTSVVAGPRPYAPTSAQAVQEAKRAFLIERREAERAYLIRQREETREFYRTSINVRGGKAISSQ